jgi:integrase
MMSIRTRGDRLWVDVSINLGGKRKRVRQALDTTDILEAKRIEAEMLAQLRNGTYKQQRADQIAVADMTLHKAIHRMTEDRWKYVKSYESFYLPQLKDIRAVIGDATLVRDIDERSLQSLVNHCRNKKNSPATINRKLTVLKTLLIYARDMWKVIDHLPNFKYVKQVESAGRIRYLSHEEEQTIHDLLSDRSDIQDLVTVLINTGCRLSEILNLEDKDIDFKANKIHIWESKTNKSRSIPMTKNVIEIFKRRGNFRLTKDTVQCVWKRTVKPAYRDVRLHDLRHTCASRLVQGGVHIQVVKEWLGHTDIKTTLRYAHIAPEHLDNALSALEIA